MPDDTASVVGVRFRNAGKLFYFHAAGMRLEAGESVIVETVRGPELARVVISPGQVVINELGREELKPILRLATDDDIRHMDALVSRAEELLPEARRLADDVHFAARIDTAEFTLDGRRLSFTFTSEEKLDYREFVRRATDRFGARVDMRQVGARDRAKLAGGYGICGRELCCSGWLTTFPSISIRMAKEQDLPLNPQKISGLCGRLLCCLSYEEEGYHEMRKTLPKLGQRCSTPTGEGRVISVNILRRLVTLVVDGQRVEVGDRDLGTVVRWDTSSKAAPPPPSISRADAIAAGMIEADEADLLPEEPVVVDWITGAPTPGSAPLGGRGRLPGPGPRRTVPPRPPRPGAQAPAAAPGGPPPRPASRAPDQRRQPPQGGQRNAPAPGPPAGRGPGPGPAGPAVGPGQARSFRRSTPEGAPRPERPASPPAADAPGASSPPGAARRRRRGRPGNPDDGAGSPPPAS